MFVHPTGYGRVTRGGRRMQAHRFVYEQHHGPIPPGLFVMHTCDNRRCVNVDHLRVGTHLDNMRDMVAKGRHPHGLTNGRHRLTDDDVREIRHRYATTDTKTTVAALAGGRTWKQVA
jgi:hypothetical protein